MRYCWAVVFRDVGIWTDWWFMYWVVFCYIGDWRFGAAFNFFEVNIAIKKVLGLCDVPIFVFFFR